LNQDCALASNFEPTLLRDSYKFLFRQHRSPRLDPAVVCPRGSKGQELKSCFGPLFHQTALLRNAIAVAAVIDKPGTNKGGTEMLSRISLISAAALIAGSLTAAAQQLPQEPRGEDGARSATPSGQLPGPDGPRGERTPSTTGEGIPSPSGKIGPGGTGQSTPQEPRGDENSRSATPSGQQPPPIPGQPRQK
jgi:hypothetical protein